MYKTVRLYTCLRSSSVRLQSNIAWVVWKGSEICCDVHHKKLKNYKSYSTRVNNDTPSPHQVSKADFGLM